jgi:signal transduction histidine kinase/CheY-like chemotaxis protein
MKSVKYLIILFLIINFDSFGSQSKKIIIPNAKNGILDLRNTSLNQKITLNGEWFFYWNQLLSPGKENLKNRRIVNFPMVWNTEKQGIKKLSAFGYASYKLSVLLPKTKQALSIAIPSMFSSYRLFINGEQVAENGKVSTSKKDFVPYSEYKNIDLKTGVDTLNIVLHISNYTHSNGGINRPLYIGTHHSIIQYKTNKIAINLFVTGCLFMGGLFFLGIYILVKKEIATLLFSLFCFVVIYRIIGVEDYILHTLLPGLDWHLTLRLEYLTLFLSIGIFSLYTRFLFKEDINKFLILTISSLCFVLTPIVLFLDPFYFTQLLYPFAFVVLVLTLYIPVVYFKAFKNKRAGSFFALLSSISVISIFFMSQVYLWYLKLPISSTFYILIILFFFFQSLILSNKIAYALKIARLEAEQGLRIKSEFLNTISHEIRTPLNSIIGLSHLLLEENPRQDQIEELNVMQLSANKLLHKVNDILENNIIEAGQFNFELSEIDIQLESEKIIKELNKFAVDKGIDLKLNIDKTIKNKVLGDVTRITQVLSNLINNGIKFTNQGSVALSLTVLEQSEKTITIEFRIKDTGIGISEEKQKIIFELFTQADSSSSRIFDGTGLGLTISKKILELQNISIKLESVLGEGSDFYFIQTFEKCLQDSNSTVSNSTSTLENNRQLAGHKILVVEDNAMNILVAKKTLENLGAIVDIACNGLEALEMVDPLRHSVVLMDLNMPVMDGYESSRKMRELNITIPIIAISACIQNEVEENIKKNGINGIVVKPFVPDELCKTILSYTINASQI